MLTMLVSEEEEQHRAGISDLTQELKAHWKAWIRKQKLA